MQEKAVLRKNPNMVARVIDDETILLPIYKSSKEINCIYTLNNAASKVWGMIDGKRTVGSVKREILKKFDATEQETNNELGKLLKDLKSIKAII